MATFRNALFAIVYGIRDLIRWLLQRASHVAALIWLCGMATFICIGTMRAQAISRAEAEKLRLAKQKIAQAHDKARAAAQNGDGGIETKAEGRAAAEVAMGDVDEIEGIRDKKLAQLGVATSGEEELLVDGGDTTDGSTLQKQLATLKQFAKIRGGPGSAEDVAAGAAVMGTPTSVPGDDDSDNMETDRIRINLPDGGIAAWIARNRKKARRGFGDAETLAILAQQQASSDAPSANSGARKLPTQAELNSLVTATAQNADAGHLVVDMSGGAQVDAAAPVHLLGSVNLLLLGSAAITSLSRPAKPKQTQPVLRTAQAAAREAEQRQISAQLETIHSGITQIVTHPPLRWAPSDNGATIFIPAQVLFQTSGAPRLSHAGNKLLSKIAALLRAATWQQIELFIDNAAPEHPLSQRRVSSKALPQGAVDELIDALKTAGVEATKAPKPPSDGSRLTKKSIVVISLTSKSTVAAPVGNKSQP